MPTGPHSTTGNGPGPTLVVAAHGILHFGWTALTGTGAKNIGSSLGGAAFGTGKPGAQNDPLRRVPDIRDEARPFPCPTLTGTRSRRVPRRVCSPCGDGGRPWRPGLRQQPRFRPASFDHFANDFHARHKCRLVSVHELQLAHTQNSLKTAAPPPIKLRRPKTGCTRDIMMVPRSHPRTAPALLPSSAPPPAANALVANELQSRRPRRIADEVINIHLYEPITHPLSRVVDAASCF